MIGGTPFPRRPDELTPEFLAAVVDREIINMTMTPIGADRGMLGDLVLVEPCYAHRLGPRHIVAKFAADREGSLASALRSESHLRELRFYDELAPSTPTRVPACYGAWYDPDSAHFLLLQEAVVADTTVDQVIGITPMDARLVLREVARLHARWWADDELVDLDWLPRLDASTRRANLAVIASKGLEPLRQLTEETIDPASWLVVEDLPARIDDVLCRLARLPSTLIHSDLRADNLLFARDPDEAVLIDWQGAGLGPPSWDLAYFLSQSLDVAMRRQHEGELIEYYCEELARFGADVSRDAIVEGYGDAMVFGLVVACSLPLVADARQPRVRDLATVMAQRALAGMADHG